MMQIYTFFIFTPYFFTYYKFFWYFFFSYPIFFGILLKIFQKIKNRPEIRAVCIRSSWHLPISSLLVGICRKEEWSQSLYKN